MECASCKMHCAIHDACVMGGGNMEYVAKHVEAAHLSLAIFEEGVGTKDLLQEVEESAHHARHM